MTSGEQEQQERDEPGIEYVHMTLPDGEPVRFNRSFGGYRFDDTEVDWLMRGGDIQFDTADWRGIRGGLDFLSYNGHDYYGLSLWDARSYTADNAPFPVSWQQHVFTPSEERDLRAGKKVLIAATNASGNRYGVHVSYRLTDDASRWAIHPHFEEFEMSAHDFTRATCPFLPVFSDRELTHEEILALRTGKSLRHRGISAKTGRPYTCTLHLRLEVGTRGFLSDDARWRVLAQFR